MSQQAVNVPQNIADVLKDQWSILDPVDLKKDKIGFHGYSTTGDLIFQDGEKIIIEIDDPAGTAEQRIQSSTKILDVLRLDLWMRVEDSSSEAIKRLQNNRFLVKNEIMRILAKNKKTIPGVRYLKFQRFLKQDELEHNLLRNFTFVTAEWYHKAE